LLDELMWRFVLLLCLFAAEVSAEPVAEPAAKPVIAKPGIEVEAWARATPPGATTGAIYGRFTDTAGKSWLAEGIKVPFAGHVMVHKTSNEEGMMRMRHTQLHIEAGETVVLEPGSTHIIT
jgi:copper(I)-binding protein